MNTLHDVSTVFISIFLEAVPFILIGSLISAIIERFISNETIAKMIPKNIILGSFVGIILGFFLPACDCAVIPVAKRLIKKKVPLNIAISFMLASPIINPVVLLSTYYAFYSSNPNIFWLRLIFGILISLIVGIIVGTLFKGNVVNSDDESCCCHEHDCEHHHENTFNFIIKHATSDFFDILKYLIIGSLIASIIQVVMPQSLLSYFNSNKIVSIIALMIFAYILSLCSTSDSFIGKSLLSSFNTNAVLAYLLLGPMIDIKNTFVLLGNFKKSFVLTLIFIIFITILLFSMVVVI